MNDISLVDWCTIIGAATAILGVLYTPLKSLYAKLNLKKATVRANFFRNNNSWILRIYNSSDCDIEAKNIKVFFENYDNFFTLWNCEKDIFPSLKRQGHFDIPFTLLISSPETLLIKIQWKQGIFCFSTKEIVQLR